MKTIRLLSLALILFLLLAVLSACAPKDARSLFDDASEKTSSLDYFHAEAEMAMKVGISGISIEIPVEGEILIDKTDENNPIMDYDITMTVPMIGTSLNFGIYAADGYMYIDMLGEKLRMPITDNTTDEQVEETAAIQENLKTVVDEALAEAEITEDGGKRSFTFTLPGDRMAEEIERLAALTETTPEGSNEAVSAELEIKDITLTFTVNEDGYFEQMDIDTEMKLSGIDLGEEAAIFGAGSLDLAISGTLHFIDIGEVVAIETPADLNSYTDAEDIPSLSDALGGTAM